MPFNPLDYPSLLTKPRRLTGKSSWVEHIPFITFLVEVLKPNILVELGTHYGDSYCAMCQAVQYNQLDTRCYSIDTWQGDAHAGYYGPEVLADLRTHHDPLYGSFSRLIQSTFDDALAYFASGTIDLLHIDGCHSYEAVKHDFECWLPKMNRNGIIIFHDTNVRELGFGVWKLWEELVAQYPSFEFLHGYGLGVLALNDNQPETLRQLMHCSKGQTAQINTFFFELGHRLKTEMELAVVEKELDQITLATAQTAGKPLMAQIFIPTDEGYSEAASFSEQITPGRWMRLSYQLDSIDERNGSSLRFDPLNQIGIIKIAGLTLCSAIDSKILWRANTPETFEAIAINGTAVRLPHPRIFQVFSCGSDPQLYLPDLEEQYDGPLKLEVWLWVETDLEDVVERINDLQAESNRVQAIELTNIEQKAQLIELRKELRQNETAITQLQETIADLEKAISTKSVEITKLENVVSERTNTVTYLTETLNKRDRQLSGMLGSVSWRITAPLRWLRWVRATYIWMALQLLYWMLTRHSTRQLWRWREFKRIGKSSLFDRVFYVDRYPEVGDSGFDPIWHYVAYGATQKRDPHLLFDTTHYLEQAQDVVSVGVNPLWHYLEYGVAQRRDPHPLFSTSFYVTQYPDVAVTGVNPLEHYLKYGAIEGRDPNPLFDTSYYLEQNPDVATAAVDPLWHYIKYGAAEGRDPSPHFNTAQYLEQYPELKQSQENPLIHYLKVGRIHGFVQLKKSVEDKQQYLPVGSSDKPAVVPQVNVAIIVCVYRGLTITKSCLESVLAATYQHSPRVIVINDNSPDTDLVEYLNSLGEQPGLEVYTNERNLGYTTSVNRGVELAGDYDVVLLNSDTEVGGDWLDRLVRQAYVADDIGTVTPFSNNATICSYPTIAGVSSLPQGETTSSLDNIFAKINSGRAVEIPTAVGFCMYIKRACLVDVGSFDEITFGRGYGEENDFCMRATQRGWRHMLAADTFVFHVGEISFAESAAQGKAVAMNTLRAKYPDYEKLIADFVQRDPARPFRLAATAGQYRFSGKPVILLISHNLGGGTERHIQELQTQIKACGARALLLRSNSPTSLVTLVSSEPDDSFEISFAPEIDFDFLVAMLQSCGVSRIHIHHLIGLDLDVERLIRELNVPFDFTAHDYYAICPQVQLVTAKGRYCGEPDMAACNACIVARPSNGASDILTWRKAQEWIFLRADRVICPSQDTANRLAHYQPPERILMIPHEAHHWPIAQKPSLDKSELLRIVLLGWLGSHKGADLVAEVVNAAFQVRAKLEFHLIGDWEKPPFIHPGAKLVVTGRYQEADLARLIAEANPHIIWFPAQWPETYSYTLSSALNSALPIVAPQLGAFHERLSGRDLTWLVNWNSSAEEMLTLFEKIRTLFMNNTYPETVLDGSEQEKSFPKENINFYQNGYLSIDNSCLPSPVIDLRKPNAISIMAVVTRNGKLPDPCAFLRLLLPLSHSGVEDNIQFTVVLPEAALGYRADILVCQRTAITDLSLVERLIEHVRHYDMQLIYDLDDDLLNLPGTHPMEEKEQYKAYRPSILRFLMQADQLWVSTEVLKQRYGSLHPNIAVLPTLIDERLWLSANHSVEDLPIKQAVRILYMGTATHGADFDLVKSDLERLKIEFGQRVEIDIIGVTTDGLPNWCQRILPPSELGQTYPAFINWLRSLPPYDIGLAPLVDNEFNQAKSSIKYLDYAALGLAVACSDVEPYRHIVRHNENGVLIPAVAGAWYQTLRQLITDQDFRLKLQTGGQQTLAAVGTLGAQSRKFQLALERVKYGDSEASLSLNGISIPLTREDLAAGFLSGNGLEIGALQKPLQVPAKVKVKYVDRLSKDKLYEHYPELRQFDLVDVDYIDDGERLMTFADNSQDFIIANHFFEHCEDPLGTLKNFARVVKPGGVIFMAVPDQRFTFDKNRQITTLEHVVCDYTEGPEWSRNTHFWEWVQLVEPNLGRTYSNLSQQEARVAELMAQGYSIHFHCWRSDDLAKMLYYGTDKLGLPLKVRLCASLGEEIIAILKVWKAS
jgi:GT2 family glycosyltransferase/glycosyltransferase involved in cell wall biosynthesis